MGGLFTPEVEEKSHTVTVTSHDGVVHPASLPCPGFEGFEKRLEVEFGFVGPHGSTVSWTDMTGIKKRGMKAGLRAIPRAELDQLLEAAACTIVSHLPNEEFDSYVLSESSLFVYPSRVVIKTCGTTKLLQAIPHLLESSEKLGMVPRRCRYTRGTFLFPEAQPAPHGSFDNEAKLLEKHFGHLGSGGKAYVLGDALKFPNWHIYVADATSPTAASKKLPKPAAEEEPTFTLEMCMTQLDRSVAQKFYQTAGFSNAAACTMATGIGELLPKSQIDDFLFEPCGYSMNGIEGGAHSTIHITPEDGHSYASFEAMGYGNKAQKLGDLVKNVAKTFNPETFSMALHADGPCPKSGPGSWGSQLPVLTDYVCTGTSKKDLPLGSAVVFHTFKKISLHPSEHEVSPLPLLEEPLRESFSLKKPLLKALSAPSSASFDLEKEVSQKFGSAVADTIASFSPAVIGQSAADVDSFITSVVEEWQAEDAFYVMDLGTVLRLYRTWTEALPRVVPHYAVKCNHDPALLSLLASLGCGFDVASKAEIEAVQSLGVSSSRMIFANPCKLPSHIRFAGKEGVNLTTFDSESELVKLKKLNPEAKAVLRLRADDRGARCPLGAKYGAEFEDCEELLLAAKRLGVNVVGVAFHVGSGASDPQSFADGIAAAKAIFETAISLGFVEMKVLDIGGGFTSKGGNGVSFAAAAASINEALNIHFPEASGVQIIGEPGRFFAEAPASLATHVFGTRFRGRGLNRKAEYWINDGLYGSMNCLLYDHAEISARPLPAPGKQRASAMANGGSPWAGEKLLKSTVFGPTCDGLDTVLRDIWLPEMESGDWLVFPRMGAYTQAAGTSFNGFSTDDIRTVYVFSPGDEEVYPVMDADLDSSSSDGGDESSDFNGSFQSESGSGDEGEELVA